MRCSRCPKILEVGAARWYCSFCQLDHCRACAEVSGQVQTVQDFFTGSNPIAQAVAQVSHMCTVDDFTASAGPGGRLSMSTVASDEVPMLSRRSSSKAERR